MQTTSTRTLTPSTLAAQRCQNFLANDQNCPSPYPTTALDARLNPYRKKYDPRVAYRQLTEQHEPGRYPILGQSIKGLYDWRRTYVDPRERPKCDYCAIYLRGSHLGEPSPDWPTYPKSQNSSKCGLSEGDTCKIAHEATGICTYMGMSVEEWAVEEFVRGRGCFWWEGVGRRSCDGCNTSGTSEHCDIWSDNGCHFCKGGGNPCLIDNNYPGGYQERLNRRSGREDSSQQSNMIAPKDDTQRDLVYLASIAMGHVTKPLGPPRELLISAADIDPGSNSYTSLAQARDALLKAGISLVRPAARTTLVTMPAQLDCARCCRFKYKCTCNPNTRGTPCNRCQQWSQRCERFVQPHTRLTAPHEDGVWNVQERTLNGRWIKEIAEPNESSKENYTKQCPPPLVQEGSSKSNSGTGDSTQSSDNTDVEMTDDDVSENNRSPPLHHLPTKITL